MLNSMAQIERIHNRNTSLPFIDAYNQHIFTDISNDMIRQMGLKGRIERCT